MCSEVMDITRDESKRILRRLELEAYSSIISAFRAQGELTRTKKKILQELGTQLSISTERHRAEVRRAYSDDRLAIVAESIYGAGSCAEWAAEGRRLVPLMPRLVPQTVFSASATAAANSAAAANAKVPVSSVNKAGSSSSALNATANSSSSVSLQNSSKAATVKQQPQTGVAQGNDTDGFDDEGKPKRKRRLSVSSLNKPVTKVTIPTPTLVSKAPTKQTTSVSTMTKSGKALGPAGTIKAIPRVSSLPSSASQVKLLTKTVAVSQAVCQAKTVLSYKTMSSVTSSPAKAQTVMTQSTPRNQTKVASATLPKAVLASKTPLSSAVKNVTTGGSSSPAAAANPIGVALKTSLTAAQLAARQKAKPAAARFKSLPGTVKFKSVTPATMGTCSTVTMVTPSPSSQASSALAATGTQPVVRVIHVPGTGGVGVSKPVVVMTTGLSKTTVAGSVPGISSAASLSKTTSQVTQNSSSSKTIVATTLSSPSKTKVTNTVTQAASSASKTVVMTTLVGGTKRVVLSVPAPLQPAPTVSIPTASSQGIVLAKTQGVGMASPAVTQSNSKKDTKASPALATVSLKPCSTQITPAPTVTTQVRSRPLPAILPAPPKPSSVTQAPTNVPTTASVRKLPTILPAPAKNVAVIPTVLVPMATSVGSHAGAQLQSSVPLAVNTTVSTIGVAGLSKVGVQQFPSVLTDASLVATEQGNQGSENSELSEVSGSKLPVTNEMPSNTADCDNNTSSEDDSLLLCSETIDSSCSIIEAPSAMDFFTGVAKSTPIKDEAKNDTAETPQTVFNLTGEQGAVHETVLDPLTLQDIEVSVSVEDTENVAVQKDLVSETETCEKHSETVMESIEKVSVQRLDISGEMSDLVGDLSEHIYSESHVADLEEGKGHKQDLESDLCSSLGGSHCGVENENEKDAEDRHPVTNPVENPGLPVQNALQIIESFVESMEANSGGKSKETQLSSNNLSPRFMESSSLESSAMPEVPVPTSEEGNVISEELTITVETADKSLGEGQNSNVVSTRFEDEGWDISDTPIDVLSTSTSSSNSATESVELTEKEIRALEAFGSIRTSGRKRKPPTSLDVSPPRQVSGWVRGALSLLQKVASYRGQGRRKGDIGAASWFLKPVDPVDAPGYFKVIKTPMDFGTIRVKLETGKYQEYTEFHADMLLVKTNCLKYNPPGHDVRQDCEEVFRFYETEFGKMLERWEKCHVSPAKKPRVASKSESST